LGHSRTKFLQQEIRKQLPQVPKRQILAEACAAQHRPCIAWPRQILSSIDSEAVMGCFRRSSHLERECLSGKFVKAAFRAAETQSVVCIGIQPLWRKRLRYIEFPRK